MKSPYFSIDARLLTLGDRAMKKIESQLKEIDEIAEENQQRVLASFIEQRVSETHFAATTGYGYGDRGRDTLDKVFAQAMQSEDALVRHSIVSGTHALTVALFGVLRPGDTLLAATGAPYDTLHEVIGIRPASGSLREFGVNYREVPLQEDGFPNIAAVCEALKEDASVKMIHVQRSRGYSLRPSLSVEKIGEVIRAVKEIRSDVIVFVDNCYGEFVERTEPTTVGADLMAGSLIKNPGGGIAENGGYLCGRADLIEQCAARLTTPGIGREVGASLGHNRGLYLGLFQAPQVVAAALKTAVFCAALFELLGFDVLPRAAEPRADIIQSVLLRQPEALAAFCRGMQRGAPVDSFVVPEAWDMPGYDDKVIMAAGAFTMGSSIELSADAPMREPYAAYMQGSLNFAAGKIGVLLAAQSMLEDGCLTV